MEIKFNSREPVYLQLVHHFKQQIAMNLLGPGQQIPSRRELAYTLKINPNTVQRAYKEMEEEGLITTESNHPSRVTTDASVIAKVRQELVAEAVEQFVASLKAINVPLEEAWNLVKSRYGNGKAGESSND